MSADAWKQWGACKGYPTNLFFPKMKADEGAGKAVCATCEVRHDCREASLLMPSDTMGIWGGLNASERADLRRQRGIYINPNTGEAMFRRQA